MNKVIIFSGRLLMASFVCIGCTSRDKPLSESYIAIEPFLQEADLKDSRDIYFYADKPRMPLPNVHCFDSEGRQIKAPPQCFQYITEYVNLLNDSLMPLMPKDEVLDRFLDSTTIIDSYDKVVRTEDVKGYDFYLFIDFIAIPDEGIRATLANAKKAVNNSRKKIKLFLVHAISKSNIKTIKHKAK